VVLFAATRPVRLRATQQYDYTDVINYEVGDEVVEIFRQQGFDLSSASIKNEITGKMHIDLKEINRLELLRMGILPQHIEKTDLCTYENPDLFFSARRQSVHCGRMLCGIMLK